MVLKRILVLTIACLALLASMPAGYAQQWPSRTVKVVVPYGVGGVTDTMARLTADRLGKIFNQTFIVENKPGAGGALGVSYAMNSAQDGYTILFIGSTMFTVLPLAHEVNYVPLKDLVPVSITGTNGMVMVVGKDAPYSTLREFIDYAKANPGKLTYASGGAATNNHLDTAYLAGREKMDMVHVPFTGGQAALTAVLSKTVDMQFVRPRRAGQSRYGQGARRVDARTHAATAQCADGRRDRPGLRICCLERLRRDWRRSEGCHRSPCGSLADHCQGS